MKFQSEITVVGMKSSKGKLDNGQEYDSTKVYCLTDLDNRKGNAKGQAVAEYNIGESTEFEKYKHLPFPFKAVADMEVVMSGTSQRFVVTGLKPVSQAKQ
jgi:hypothetical protein